jgi:Domain of unknown function (DUF4190)
MGRVRGQAGLVASKPQVPVIPDAPTNGMAIASLVLGLLWLGGTGSLLAIIFGFIGRGQINRRGQDGRGMAVTGIVLGFIGLASTLIWVIVLVSAGLSAKTMAAEIEANPTSNGHTIASVTCTHVPGSPTDPDGRTYNYQCTGYDQTAGGPVIIYADRAADGSVSWTVLPS